MQGALLDALPHCGSEPVMIVGNDCVEPDLFTQVRNELHNCDGVITARQVHTYFPGGYLVLQPNTYNLKGIQEKPGEGNEPSNFVNLVVHAHKNAAELLNILKQTQSAKDDAYERALTQLFQQKHYQALPYVGTWFPLKYPWHILSFSSHFLQKQELSLHPSSSVHPTAVIDGKVTLGRGVKIYPGASVCGPCTIGDRTIVGNNALVRGSSIGADCVIGYNSEVKDSVLYDHVWTHSTYIAESVVGHNVSFGAGCITANLRLDEGEVYSQVKERKYNTHLQKFGTVIGENVRIGIQVGLQPGVKIGSDTFINSRTLVTTDIPEKSFVCEKHGELTVKENHFPCPQPELREGFRGKILKK